jgi:signal transduction histidine kinase
MKAPSLIRSIRLRLALTYTVVVFALAVLVVGVVNLALTRSLEGEAVSGGRQLTTVIDPLSGESVTVERDVQIQFVTLEQLVNARAIDELQRISLWLLIGLFPVSVGVGWFIADRALRPIGEITAVAQDIQRTDDLSRRIDLEGPDDELKDLAETFDGMLDQIEDGVKSRQAFVQDISHELRNPLAVMATNLDVVLADNTAGVDDYRETAEIVRRTVDRTARTVDDLVIFARHEVPDAKRVTVDLGQVLAEVMDEHHGAIESRRIRMVQTGTGAIVRADRRGIKRAAGNLVNNAVRLTRPGSTVQCGTGQLRGWAWLAVADDGPGIDPRDHEQVFRRFWSDDTSSIGGEERSGLGLAITRQVAESHDGLVTVRSELGAGAEFTLWLPVSAAADRDDVTTDGIHPRHELPSIPSRGPA